MPGRVLVTGASGFVGRNTLAALAARGFEVHAVARNPPAESSVQWHAADLLAPVELDELVAGVRPTHLLHLAWYAEHGRFWDAPENVDWVAASLRLLRAFAAAGGHRAVFAGTCAEYDWTGDCCSAATPLAPATPYGAAKDALRRVVDAAAPGLGVSHAWGRIFFVFGPGEPPTRVVASVARALVRGEPVDCTSGEQVRDFLYAGDLGEAFAALVDTDAVGAFDLGSGVGIRLATLLLRLQELAGRDGLVRLGGLGARPEPARIVAEPNRLTAAVGWAPGDLDAGLEATLAWWRENDVR
jgi:nucleoside-diphosphate-sugar epimerase